MSSTDTIGGMRGRPVRALSLAAAGLLTALVVTLLTWRNAPYSAPVWLMIELPGVLFAVSGLVLGLRRPGRGVGPHMAVVGCAWYAGALQASDHRWLFVVGYVLFFVPLVVFTHMVLALPDGRLTRGGRVNVTAQYIAAVLLQVVNLLRDGTPEPEMWGRNGGRQADSFWGWLGNGLMLAFVVVSVGQVVRKWRRSGGPERREYTLVWASVLGVGAVTGGTAVLYLVGVSWLDRQRLAAALGLSVLVMPLAVAAGLLRARLARLAVARLVVRLDQAVEPAEVQAAVSRALGDPSLRLHFPLPGGAGYVGVDGRTVPALIHAGQATTAVERQGRVLAVLVHDPALRRQRPLVESVVAAARLSLDNARLYAAQHAQLEQLRESRARVVVASDAERVRIQRDLHDGVQHKLLTMGMFLGRARDGLTARDDVLARRLDTLGTMIAEVIRDVRDLAEDICPPALAEQGLAAAIESVAERAPLPVVVDIPPTRWPEHVERVAYFVVAEALANVYKHAEAGAVTVHVADEPLRLVVTVRDDGRGGADPDKGSGLRGLHDRVGALGGTLTVDSVPGSGTVLVATLPI
ncbi:sensor histidine kinase [Actinomadura atramentaria]|uniref:sensor histidine kinase n=1 Tax=Actinomadura atramentaria TaxID=1990 RepID=UPI00039F4ABB|nr:sensor histidine kinase [Actinomadura atramentaria]